MIVSLLYHCYFPIAEGDEHMAQDAKKKKEQILAAQANANDTQAIAMQTKQEAEKLR
jgi:hypothetical protein